MTKLTICMYGAASDRIDSIYINAAEALGKEIAKRHHKLIYGGGASGLMGSCANGVLENGGEVTGVVPTFMNKFEPIKSECTEIVRTETMSLRKEVMEENADAFVIAPGGIGTFDEFFQILTLTELGRSAKPIIVYNISGFYDDTIAIIDKLIGMGFIRESVKSLFSVCETPEEVLNAVEWLTSQQVLNCADKQLNPTTLIMLGGMWNKTEDTGSLWSSICKGLTHSDMSL